MRQWRTLCAVLHIMFWNRCASGDTVDNGLLGEPHIQCLSDSFIVTFLTQEAFEGHAYVKGHYSNRGCRTDATLDQKVNLTVPFSTCDVIRQRSHNPKGLMITTTVIISFHPMFVTKVDKSYKVQCFYAELAKTVTQDLEVGVGRNMEKKVMVSVSKDRPPRPPAHDIPEGSQRQPEERPVEVNSPLPDCSYKVLTETKDGEPVKFATVGQQVYHQWSCESENVTESPFCATVHSCSVREEGGREVSLLDENGCAVDRFLLNNLDYTSDMTGGQVSQVFKFADQPTLFFQCQIRLSLKENGICKRSSDECPRAVRGKRDVDVDDNVIDVFSQHMTVFEIDDPISSALAREIGSMSNGDICLSPPMAGALSAGLGSLIIVSIVSMLIVCYRSRSMNAKLLP